MNQLMQIRRMRRNMEMLNSGRTSEEPGNLVENSLAESVNAELRSSAPSPTSMDHNYEGRPLDDWAVNRRIILESRRLENSLTLPGEQLPEPEETRPLINERRRALYDERQQNHEDAARSQAREERLRLRNREAAARSRARVLMNRMNHDIPSWFAGGDPRSSGAFGTEWQERLQRATEREAARRLAAAQAASLERADPTSSLTMRSLDPSVLNHNDAELASEPVMNPEDNEDQRNAATSQTEANAPSAGDAGASQEADPSAGSTSSSAVDEARRDRRRTVDISSENRRVERRMELFSRHIEHMRRICRESISELNSTHSERRQTVRKTFILSPSRVL